MNKKIIIFGILSIVFLLGIVIAQVTLTNADDTITLTGERQSVLARVNGITRIDINIPGIVCDGTHCFTKGNVFQKGLINTPIRIPDLGSNYTDATLKANITAEVQLILDRYADAQIERESRVSKETVRIEEGTITRR